MFFGLNSFFIEICFLYQDVDFKFVMIITYFSLASCFYRSVILIY